MTTMVEDNISPQTTEIINREAPQMVGILKEMTKGLNEVMMKVSVLTAKVKQGDFLRKEGISYLEAKHLLLLNYCQSLVYYLLRKAKGLPIEGHPVVKSLVEIRLFLEKIRPIDKKLEYQIKKLSNLCATKNDVEDTKSVEKESDTKKDLLKYRPNPDMLDIPETKEGKGGVYKPPKNMRTIMDEDKISRQERNAKRMEERTARRAGESDYVKALVDDLEGKPEELKDTYGVDNIEHKRFLSKMEKRAREEEDQFARAPITKADKMKMRHMKKSRNGLLDLAENIFEDVRGLQTEDNGVAEIPSTGFGNDGSNKSGKKFKRRRK